MMAKLTDDDRRLGPIVYGRTSGWRPLSLVWSSGGGEDNEPGNTLTAYAFGWCARVGVPSLIPPYRVKHVAVSWDAATVARLGRDWYFEVFPREYGFSLSEGFLQVFFGAQTGDSSTTQDWAKHLPWTQWRFVRISLYDASGNLFWARTEKQRGEWRAEFDATEACPKVSFKFDDYDGKRITATTHIAERQWKFGAGWFWWLSVFRADKVVRSLTLNFSEEVGPEKGSWKGGITGHGIDMLPGELHEDAFRRYCAREHEHKSSRYRLTFVGRVDDRSAT